MIHDVPESKNLGDIAKIDIENLQDFNLLTWGFPCQDISLTGKMKGIQKGTQSGLYYEGYKILKAKLPEYSIIENVKNLTSKRFRSQFEEILKDIEELGYNNYWKILNAKDYGIPQNRKRIFIISIRKDIDKKNFKFPLPQTLNLKLKDILEDIVDEKYYLTQKQIGDLVKKELPKLENSNNTTNETSREPYILIRENTKKGYVKAHEGDSINYTYPNCRTKRGRVGKGISNTLLTASNMATLIKVNESVYNNSLANLISTDGKSVMRMRKLTPLEHWRLTGFDDMDFYKIRTIKISDTQAYKQAGNSIVVNVVEAILYELLIEN